MRFLIHEDGNLFKKNYLFFYTLKNEGIVVKISYNCEDITKKVFWENPQVEILHFLIIQNQIQEI